MVPLALWHASTEPQTLWHAQVMSPPQAAGMVRQPCAVAVVPSPWQPGEPLQSAGMVPEGQLVSVDGVQVLSTRYRQNSLLVQVEPLQAPPASSSSPPMPSVLHAESVAAGAEIAAEAMSRAARLPRRTRAEEDMAPLCSALRCEARCP